MKKRKSIFIIMLILAIVLVCVSTLFACKEEDPNDPIELKEGAVLEGIEGGAVNGLNISLEVSKDTNNIDLSNIITASEGASWKLYSDAGGVSEVATNSALNLEDGGNIFYVIITSEDGKARTVYTLYIFKDFDVLLTLTKNIEGAGTVEGGGTYISRDTPTIKATTNEGFIFDGWYEDEEKISSDASYKIIEITSNKTYEARWKGKPYTLAITKNIGAAGTVTGAGTYDNQGQVTLVATTNAGYTFDGWYEGTTKKYSNSKWIFDMPYAPNGINYEARWTAKPFTITFNSNAGSVVNSITKDYGSEVTKPADPTKEGYTFGGWYSDVNLTNAYTFNTMQAANITLYAKWNIEKYSITLNRDVEGAGNVEGAGSYDYNSNITVIATTTDDGYTFDGWYEGTTRVCETANYKFNVPAHNRILKAKWIPKPYALTISKNISVAGSVEGANTYSYKGQVTLEATTNRGYTFDGWYEGTTKKSSNSQWIFDMPYAPNGINYEARWLPYQRVDEDGTPNLNGQYVFFGEFPQTYEPNPSEKVDLNAPTETVGGYTYHIGTDGVTRYLEVQSNVHWEAYTWDPYVFKFKDGTAISNDPTTYYFKVEPIKWRILNYNDLMANGGNKALLFCESIIHHMSYDNTGEISNRYIPSDVRAWLNSKSAEGIELNDGFYKTALTDLQRQRIQPTSIDNSASSTGYDPNIYATDEITYDKVFLLSYAEVKNVAYGFNGDMTVQDTARRKQTSDYVRATGAFMDRAQHLYGNAYWYLRSPDCNDTVDPSNTYGETAELRSVHPDGKGRDDLLITDPATGVVPALWLGLSDVNQVILTKAINNAGTVSGGGEKSYGTQVIVGATANEGYEFDGWYENGVKIEEAGATYEFTMPATSRILQARWKVMLTLQNSIAKAGTISGGGYIAYGGNAQLSVTPKSGYTFAGWYNNDVLVSEEYNYTLASMPFSPLTIEARWFAFQRINYYGEPAEDGGYILFGEYPQTLMESDVYILNPNAPEANGYYLGSDECYYKAFSAIPYLPNEYMFSDNVTRINTGTTYYFKVEPIRWKIIDETEDNKAFLLCDLIIANNIFSDTDSNYELSALRNWLIGEFYNTAFGKLQQGLIKTTLVDNSLASTHGNPENPNTCDNTNDKIFALSYVEAQSGVYGLGNEEARKKITSDYSRATGAYVENDFGHGPWWLRSPYHEYNWVTYFVYADGFVVPGGIDTSACGIVPALWMHLSKAYEVVVNKNLNGEGGTVTGDGYVPHNSQVTLTATCNPGYIFGGWYVNEELQSANTTWQFNMTEEKTKVVEARWLIYQRVNAAGEPAEDGGYILFGEYAQTRVSNLDEIDIAGGEQSDGYYLGKDGVTRYKRVVADEIPPTCDNTFSDGTVIEEGTAYYFKVEPIKWRIVTINGQSAFLISDNALTTMRYNDYYEGTNQYGKYANNYAASEIRNWLIGEFYNTAFNVSQQGAIQLTTVDNTATSTGDGFNPYYCENTDDKVFLPSFQEMTNAQYGFDYADHSDEKRKKGTTDHCMATGAWSFERYSYWWLRSPYGPCGREDDGALACAFDTTGTYEYMMGGIEVGNGLLGVVPALWINLSI